MGYRIYETLCKEKGLTPNKVAKELGIASATISDWKYGRSQPKIDKRRKIAEYFNVSVDYLDGIQDGKPFEISDVYLSLAKDMQKDGIDPEDVRMLLNTIKKYRGNS